MTSTLVQYHTNKAFRNQSLNKTTCNTEKMHIYKIYFVENIIKAIII